MVMENGAIPNCDDVVVFWVLMPNWAKGLKSLIILIEGFSNNFRVFV